MHRISMLILAFVVLLVAGTASAVPPTVSNVTAEQWTDASKLVDISYKVSDPDSSTVHVRVKVSTDGGNSYNFLPVSLTGDVGEVPVTPVPTQKCIVWNAGQDMPYTFGENFRVAVIADDCGGYTGEMITIPAGPFLMGNRGDEPYSHPHEFPQHDVCLTEYQIGKYEVTRGEYQRFILAGGYENPGYWSDQGWAWRADNTVTQPAYWNAQQNWGDPPGTFTQTDRHPVVGVSWYEAEAFCAWAGGRLPTEAEWEKAARWVAATSTPRIYPWGDVWDPSRCKWLNDVLYPGYQTAPVGSYINPSGESPYGCADMAANVGEWCKDWYQGDYYDQRPPPPECWVDPQGPATGTYRIERGESWYPTYYGYFRCAYRHSDAPTIRDLRTGFRCARTP